MIVLDANAAIGMVRESAEDIEDPAIDRFSLLDDKVIAPEFFCIEAAHVAWKYTHVNLLDEREALNMMKATIECVEEFADNDALLAESLSESVRLDHSLYDMLYFVLARRSNAVLLTCDRKLAKLCRENNVECLELIDF